MDLKKENLLHRLKSCVRLVTSKNINATGIKVGLENIEQESGKFIQTDSTFEGFGSDFEPGNILYGKLRPYLAKSYLASFAGQAIGDFFVLNVLKNSDPKFINYVLLSPCTTSKINDRVFGAKMPRVSWNDFSNVEVWLPDLIEQRAISHYLDEHIALIDNKISLLKKKVELLKEYRKSVIFDSVIFGLDKKATLKDSGIPLFERIPQGWEIGRIKTLLNQLPKSSFPSGDQIEDGEFKFYVSGDNIKKIASYNLIKEAILLPTGGRFFTHYNPMDTKAAYSTDCAAFELKSNKAVLKYIMYVFKCNEFSLNDLLFKGTGLKHLNRQGLLGLHIPLPPVNIQQEIVEYLDIKIPEIDKHISVIERMIELQASLKKSLIHEVVTGKRRVIAN